MSSLDHARLGLLVQRQGKWGQRCVLDPAWLAESRTPCPVNLQYGLLWWLNTACAQFPGAPATAYAARGAGSNAIVIDPSTICSRWCGGSTGRAFPSSSAS